MTDSALDKTNQPRPWHEWREQYPGRPWWWWREQCQAYVLVNQRMFPNRSELAIVMAIVTLHWNRDPKGEIDPSYATIGEKVTLSRYTVSDEIEVIEQLPLVAVEHRHDKHNPKKKLTCVFTPLWDGVDRVPNDPVDTVDKSKGGVGEGVGSHGHPTPVANSTPPMTPSLNQERLLAGGQRALVEEARARPPLDSRISVTLSSSEEFRQWLATPKEQRWELGSRKKST